MSWKIAVIGGGSVLWMPRLGCDMFLEDSLDGSELVLGQALPWRAEYPSSLSAALVLSDLQPPLP